MTETKMAREHLFCTRCAKELLPDDDVCVILDNWLQWEHYTKLGKHAGCYCSPDCFMDDWSGERMTVAEYLEVMV